MRGGVSVLISQALVVVHHHVHILRVEHFAQSLDRFEGIGAGDLTLHCRTRRLALEQGLLGSIGRIGSGGSSGGHLTVIAVLNCRCNGPKSRDD
jgi:hypothetical protein